MNPREPELHADTPDDLPRHADLAPVALVVMSFPVGIVIWAYAIMALAGAL